MPFTFANELPTDSTSGLLVPGLNMDATCQSSDGPRFGLREPAVRQAAVLRIEDDQPLRPRRGRAERFARQQRRKEWSGESRAGSTLEKESSFHGSSFTRERNDWVWVRSVSRLMML